ncbi:MAG: phage holin family protein [Bryobacterales bacterium]|jgi:putative membrane protein|nr:phage holin family protein [Bryobacterales bacterium]
MLNLLVQWIVVAVAILVAAYVLPGMKIKNFKIALLAAVVMGIVNALIQPVVAFLAIPVTFITFGLFAWVVNGLMLMLVAKLTPEFEVNGCFTAILGSVIISLVSAGLMAFAPFAN